MYARRSAALLTTVLMLFGLVCAAPAGADVDQCAPPG